MSNWIKIDSANDGTLPLDGIVVDTKIDDANGLRNEQQLRRSGNLWYFPDGSMYVYYWPTHWKAKGGQ